MKRKDYEKELGKLQVRLCHLQRWVKEKGLRVVVVFEGRDGAGKGGTIRALTERLSPAQRAAQRPLGSFALGQSLAALSSLEAATTAGDHVVVVEVAFTTTGRGWRASLITSPERMHADSGTMLWMLGELRLR